MEERGVEGEGSVGVGGGFFVMGIFDGGDFW